MATNVELISRQCALLTHRIAPLVDRGTKYALLDFPHHANVGDNAIWLGERALLSAIMGGEPAYVCTYKSFDAQALEAACPAGPIFLHGGGNFGDIWPVHQNFRERILDRMLGRKVIQLPQTIAFSDPHRAHALRARIARHGDFHLFVRDETSLAFARENLECYIERVPDAAVGMGALARRGRLRSDIVLLLRTDKEKSGQDMSCLLDLPASCAFDWLDEFPSFRRKVAMLANTSSYALGRFDSNKRRLTAFDFTARSRVARGLRMLCSGNIVVTDRLHAHILSMLLDIPHIAMDNNYRKISNYIDAWNKDYEKVLLATCPEDVPRLLGHAKSMLCPQATTHWQ
ncbi:polysaccharide pyruvyl transferase family protein [Methylocystis sp. B8]|uniref:polysaccharide pyruvyl transferase family protein n=1 Tax=Methylocystis sp. B8 TaxID=544938 RepID=UPI0010FE1D31|nr:polysaccharide pyruvyl transferase family protein [Methylocystis sp. B8]TLG71413.1 exopolysaccharide biosynthesis protein [Methylocystis sp. B8]